ncbi:MAG: signal peptide peptidase SppA [Proteobacteria bacterium]|nr:signal peptide peptidase SppA [Pseudomonadota bacterium]
MLASLLIALALGQSPDRPALVASSIATESGPGTLWVNPANLAYDADRRGGIFIHQPIQGGARSIALTAGVGSLGFGVHNFSGADGTNQWTIDYASGFELPERLAIGWRLAWHLGAEDGNFVAYDGSASWRPLPWFGIGTTFRNMGSPHTGAPAHTGGGFAVRPFGDALTVGADLFRDFGPVSTDRVQVAARLRPVEGLFLRGAASKVLDDGTPLTWSMGLELYFNGFGGGVGTTSEWTDGAVTAFLGTDEPGETLFRSGRRVAAAPIADHPYQPPTTLFLEPERSWLQTLELLRQVESDRGTRGVVISLGAGSMSFARYEEIRARVTSLRSHGKNVLVYLQGAPGNGAYYVAAAADRVALHPAAELRFVGLSAELTHFGGAFDVLGVEPQFVRRSEYKSAVEQYTETGPSEASLEQMNAILDDTYESLVTGVAEGREVSPEVVEEWVNGAPWPAERALDLGLVDVLLYPDQVEGELDWLYGGSVRITPIDRLPQPRSPWEDPSRIAVIYVEGVITSGPSSSGGILGAKSSGSATVTKQLFEAAKDPTVRAVVMRVDSPGGSAYASDEIWRATQLVQREGKPVVVSMGGVAASGGYYVSAGADQILAEPTTITGSIGVYSGKFALEGLAENLGVHSEQLARGRNATIESPFAPWDGIQEARMESLVEATYDQFKDRVSTGRGLTDEQVEEVARGRVWSGKRAAEVGLVDELGGLQEAVVAARELAGIPERRKISLISYSPTAAPLESLAPSLIQAFVPLPILQSWEARLHKQPGQLIPPALSMGLTLAQQEDLVWMVDPSLLSVEIR